MEHQSGITLRQYIDRIDDEMANFTEETSSPPDLSDEQLVICLSSAIEALQAYKAEVEAR